MTTVLFPPKGGSRAGTHVPVRYVSPCHLVEPAPSLWGCRLIYYIF